MDVYKGDIEWIDRVDIDGPIAAVPVRWPQEYREAYDAATATAISEGHAEEEAVYGFMQRLLSMHPSYKKTGDPYVPMASFGNQRTEIPSDLTDRDAEAIRKLIDKSGDIALQARLYDLLYARAGKDYRSAALAAPLMLAAAKALSGGGHAHYLKEGMLRSIQLTRQTAWNGKTGEQVREDVAQNTRAAAGASDDTELLFMLRLVRSEQLGDREEWRRLASDAASRLKSAGDEHAAQQYYELVIGFNQALNDVAGQHAGYCEIGESLVRQALARATGSSASFMAAAEILRSGIVALQRGKASKERIDELQTLLNEYQSRIGDEMFSTGADIDITGQVEAMRKHVSGQEFGTALLRLAFGTPLIDVTALRQRVLDLAKANPMLFLLDTQVMDSSGKTRQRQRGILDLQGDEFEKELRLKMMAQAILLDWSLRAQGQIEPARQIVFTEHHPTIDDLIPVVQSNPFIPPGHEGLILRGLLAGFESDFVVASHILVPQFEACFRYVLESHNVHLTTFEPDGTQPYKLWGGMLDIPKIKEIFGDDCIFEIEGILLNEAGYNFRNKLSHGMLTEMQCISVPAVTAWWLMLRLCLVPIVDRFATHKSVEDSDSP